MRAQPVPKASIAMSAATAEARPPLLNSLLNIEAALPQARIKQWKVPMNQFGFLWLAVTLGFLGRLLYQLAFLSGYRTGLENVEDERISAILQGVESNYDTDLFTPILHEIEELSHVPYGKDPRSAVAMRVIADHSRAATFLISDGVLPSNEGRGYVLRRIMRRAMRHGKILGIDGPFLYRLPYPSPGSKGMN
jgi:hypothetical protein